ncbi:glycosylphosphatidylinositol anchor biosynthesis [Mortierella alpina]|nr:glycosylphosphatidylinositol anchor biosynthesis [Mortierella alpina]
MKPVLRVHQWPDASLFAGLVAFRAINALFVRTYFSPDEYWQALEVAHRAVFGYGYLTWEWNVALRSVLHPALFAALYRVLSILGLDDSRLFIYAPRLLQSVFAATADLYTYRFAYRLFENQVIANWTLFLSVLSWWNFFCSTRTLANSMEAALTIIALYYWPFTTASPSTTAPITPSSKGSLESEMQDQLPEPAQHATGCLQTSLAIASLTCIFRPTAAILWIFLGTSLLLGYFKKGDIPSFITTILSATLIGGAAIVGSAVLDSTLFYSEWVWTPINFIRVNILEGISLFYGSSPWHWYLSQGLPILFGIYLPLIVLGAWRSWNTPASGLNAHLRHQVLYFSIWMVTVYSSLQHKEWRFLYPLLYPLLPYAGDSIYRTSLHSSTTNGSTQRRLSSKGAKGMMVVLVVVNAVMAWYTVWVHQRGVVDVMEWIRNQARQTDQIRSLGVLMPCHSTPWYSSVHLRNKAPLDMWFVTCSPPLGDINHAAYKDESDIFYEDPVAFMTERTKAQIRDRGSKDSHLVFFEDLLRSHAEMVPWLEGQGYQECARFFNSHFHDDSRRRGDVLVYCTMK